MGKQPAEITLTFQFLPLHAQNSLFTAGIKGWIDASTSGKHEKVGHLNNGIVEVKGSTPFGSTK